MRKPNLQSIQKKIQQLELQAEKVRKSEARGVIEKIRAAIEHYGLTATDLFGAGSGPRRGRPPGKKAGAKQVSPKRAPRKIAVKYRDSSGNTWTGRGSQPRWLVAALKEGKKVEDFAVKR